MEAATESHGSFPPSEPLSTATNNYRSGPLHTFAVALITIAHNAYRRTEELHTPIGSLARRVDSLASPVACTILSQWLVILSLIDSQIIAFENTAKIIFPPSTHMFDKIHRIVDASETLPRKFDDITAHFPTMVRRVPILNWVISNLCIGLNILISMLGDWASDGMKEKEIVVDVNSDEPANETPMLEERPDELKDDGHIETQDSIEKLPISDDIQQDEHKVGKKKKKKPRACNIEDAEHIDNTHEGILGAQEMIVEKEGSDEKGEKKSIITENEAHEQVGKVGHVDDPILELFDAGWQSTHQ